MKNTSTLNWLSIACAVLINLSLTFCSGGAMANDLVSDVKGVRETNRAARIDISEIARRHVVSGSDQGSLLRQLEVQGFKCHQRKTEVSDSQASGIWDCSLDMRNWYQFGFGDEVRLQIYFVEGKVTGVAGELIYLSL